MRTMRDLMESASLLAEKNWFGGKNKELSAMAVDEVVNLVAERLHWHNIGPVNSGEEIELWGDHKDGDMYTLQNQYVGIVMVLYGCYTGDVEVPAKNIVVAAKRFRDSWASNPFTATLGDHDSEITHADNVTYLRVRVDGKTLDEVVTKITDFVQKYTNIMADIIEKEEDEAAKQKALEDELAASRPRKTTAKKKKKPAPAALPPEDEDVDETE